MPDSAFNARYSHDVTSNPLYFFKKYLDINFICDRIKACLVFAGGDKECLLTNFAMSFNLPTWIEMSAKSN